MMRPEELDRLLAQAPRYSAPDVLRARVREIGERPEAATVVAPKRFRWFRLRSIAAGLVVALVSSGATWLAMREPSAVTVERSVLAAHLASLKPGQLTQVVSNNQHNVKPWFNGRVDVAPAVPDLSAAGFTLVGGRVDQVGAHAAAVVVYSRRLHTVNVFAWPAQLGPSRPEWSTLSGFNVAHWRKDGVEEFAVSDLNRAEMDELVRGFVSR